LFDAIEGVRLANITLRQQGTAARFSLTVAGNFVAEKEKVEFDNLLSANDPDRRVRYAGFAAGEVKDRLFKEADVFCFPTYFYAESFGLVVVESMAYGLPVVTTLWRSVPEVLPKGYPGLVKIRAPREVAEVLLKLTLQNRFAEDREHFIDHYLLDRHLENLARAIHCTEDSSESADSLPTVLMGA